MPSLLKRMRISEISGCGRGANPGAQTVLMKMDLEKGGPGSGRYPAGSGKEANLSSGEQEALDDGIDSALKEANAKHPDEIGPDFVPGVMDRLSDHFGRDLTSAEKGYIRSAVANFKKLDTPSESMGLVKKILKAIGLSDKTVSNILKEEDAMADETLVKQIEELTATVKMLKAENEELKMTPEEIAAKKKAAEEKAAGCESPVGKAVEEIQKKYEDLQKSHDVLKAQLEKAAETSAISKIATEELSEVGEVAKTEPLAKAIYEIRKAGKKDEADAIVKQLVTTSKQLKAAGLFSVVGKDGGDCQTAADKIEKMAIELSKSSGISKEQAVSKVLEQNPQLYAQSEAERKGGKS